MNKQVSILIGMLLGIILTIVAFLIANYGNQSAKIIEQSSERKILYWVAPMDPNYRREKAGKSPMGMDLLPVYQQDQANSNVNSGLVKISPEVVNNLGVRLAKVTKAPMVTKIKTVGYITFDEDLMVHIHPRLDGWIEKLFVKAEGESVVKGQPLYQIYSPELVNAQEELLLALKRNNQRLINGAQQRLASFQVSPAIIESIKSRRKVKQSITFYAPQNGIVQSLSIRQGHHVKPGTKIMSIGSIEQVWVEVGIFEKQLPWIQLGDKAQMKVDFLPARKWLGEIDFIYPTLDKKTRTAKVRLKFSNKDRALKPNMYAEVGISSQGAEESVLVPRDAVIRTGYEDKVVLGLGEGRFKSIEVETGLQNQEYIEVLNGLNVGDDVVISAQFLIDSESSKSSDFKRMEVATDNVDVRAQEMGSRDKTAVTQGVINSINNAERILNISREPITKWNRPAATMDFVLSDKLDISELKAGDYVYFKFEVAKKFVILELEKDKDNKHKQQYMNPENQ